MLNVIITRHQAGQICGGEVALLKTGAKLSILLDISHGKTHLLA
jgi:hypothetical protein